MIDFSRMKDAIYTWINTYTGIECIWQFQNAPIPDKPFFALRLSSFTQIGKAEPVDAVAPITPGDKDIYTTYNFILEILGFGPGIVQNTVQLKSSLAIESIHDTLKTTGGVISFNDTNPVQDISGLDEALNEERSSWDVQMRTCELITNIPFGQIDIVNAQGTYKNPGKPDLVTNFNIDSTI